MGRVFYLDMEPQRKLILLSLADNANDNGRCYPSQALTALKSSISVRRCRDHLHGLEYLAPPGRSGTRDWVCDPEKAHRCPRWEHRGDRGLGWRLGSPSPGLTNLSQRVISMRSKKLTLRGA